MSAALRRLVLAVAASVLLAAMAPTASIGAPIVLEDGVAFLEIDPENADGLTGWTVNGVPHVRTQSVWFGLGTGPEQPVSALDLVSAVASDASGDGMDDTLAIVYQDPLDSLRIELHYLLSGTPIAIPAGEVHSSVHFQYRVIALSAALDVRIFEYTDVDLFNSYADDELTYFEQPFADNVTDSSGLGRYESDWGPPPDAVEAAVFDTTLASLQDDQPTVLGGALTALGDITATASWSLHVPTSAQEGIWIQGVHAIHVVPEPGTAFLFAFGVAIVAARRGNAR